MLLFRGKNFRHAFTELSSIPTFFRDVPYVALSATIPHSMVTTTLPKALGMVNPHIITANPDRPNIFLDKMKKPSSTDIAACYDSVLKPICQQLKEQKSSFPVTLMYVPHPANARGQAICSQLFGANDITTSLYSSLYHNQAEDVKQITLDELRKDSPRIRLVFCSATVSMGFDSPSFTNIIHLRPPRNIMDYMQQIGRAGRRGQQSKATLYYNASDIAKNIVGNTQEIIDFCHNNETCLRLQLLQWFGFTEPAVVINKCKCCVNCIAKCDCNDCVA